ncbi:MAG TPA: chemotaxis protein CheW [Armatimonadota bacterium]|nr:chemotaxis protein CheW [Armatimonadota bacterium]
MATVDSSTVVRDSEEQLVVFTLGDEAYGVNIEAVNTIIRLPDITCVPHTPSYVRGVMNLRGVIVPVIDLRLRFGLPVTEATKATRVVVVEQGGLLVGMVVDAVTETLRLPAASIEALSPLVISVDSRYLRGVGKIEDRLIILLALDKVIEDKEAEQLTTTVDDQNAN